jgi:hypothetical protein
MEIRETTEQDDDIFVRHCLATWATLGWPEERFFPDAAERIRQGMQDIRQRHPMGGFLAMDGEEVVGSIIYYLHYLPYPRVVRPAYFDLAYVCGMFVSQTGHRAPPDGTHRQPSTFARQHLDRAALHAERPRVLRTAGLCPGIGTAAGLVMAAQPADVDEFSCA